MRRRKSRSAGSLRRSKCRNLDCFECQEPATQRIRRSAFDAAIGADHAVCRDEQIERRLAHRRRDAAMSERPADGPRYVRVRNAIAEFKLRDEPPHSDFELGSDQTQWQMERAQPLAKICANLGASFAQQRVGRAAAESSVPDAAKLARDDFIAVARQEKRDAQRGRNGQLQPVMRIPLFHDRQFAISALRFAGVARATTRSFLAGARP